MKVLFLTLLSFNLYAAVSEEVLIRGKIGSSFDEEKVQVTDSLGQTYFLKRSVFPEGFQFKQGNDFTIEVSESELAGIKIKKK